MKISELKRKSTANKPSALLSARIASEKAMQSLGDFLKMYDFDSEEEIRQAVRMLVHAETNDLYIANKSNRDNDGDLRVMYLRANKLRTQSGALDKFAGKMSQDLWFSFFAPKKRAERIERMFASEPNRKEWQRASEQIRRIYSLTDLDIEKLTFFCAMVKAGDAFPDSLRRMLYIWAQEKKTGKTTTAKIITSVLNGYEDIENYTLYQSDLSREMQMAAYSVPKISEYRCVMMDEAFFKDMDKTYNKFKQMITSSNGTARLPYGEEFMWQGKRNYVATSNDRLSNFIKDWNDRRYLSIEFRNAPESMELDELMGVWKSFILNATLPVGESFDTWAIRLDEVCEEKGDKAVIADEYYELLMADEFNTWVVDVDNTNKAHRLYKTANANRCTLGRVINELVKETNDNTIRGRRMEVEHAMVRLLGPQDSHGYWFFDDIREKLAEIKVSDFDANYYKQDKGSNDIFE